MIALPNNSSSSKQGHGGGQEQDTSRMSSAEKESTSPSTLIKVSSIIKKGALDSDSGKDIIRKDPFQNMWSTDIFRDYPSKPPLLQPLRSKATKTNSTVSNYNRSIYRSCTFG
jgi:hypothetical protein